MVSKIEFQRAYGILLEECSKELGSGEKLLLKKCLEECVKGVQGKISDKIIWKAIKDYQINYH